VSSGTAALHLVLRYIGVGRGDRVAVQSATFVGSVYPLLYLGAEPVLLTARMCRATSIRISSASTSPSRRGRIASQRF
jgi:hypothetical protein